MLADFKNRSKVIRDALKNAAWFNKTKPDSGAERAKKSDTLRLTARRYYIGDQQVYPTERQRAYLDLHDGDTMKFTVNHCRTIIDSMVERLEVSGVDVSSPVVEVDGEIEEPDVDIMTGGLDDIISSGLPPEEVVDEDGAALDALVAQWWTDNKMDAAQKELYRRAFIDGEAFIVAEWEEGTEAEPESRPLWRMYPRFISMENGGDGYGVWMKYENDDPYADPLFAVKQWQEVFEDDKGREQTRGRRVVYFPDMIVYEIDEGKGWIEDPKKPPIPWTIPTGDVVNVSLDEGEEVDLEAVADALSPPIGIPVAHFKTPGLMSELKNVIAMQDLLNKTWLDLLAAADGTAFQTIITIGFLATTDGAPARDDGSNKVLMIPGNSYGTQKNPGQAKVEIVPPGSLEQLLNLEERIIKRMASITSTPLSRFQDSKMIAGEGTLRQQEAPLVAKLQERSTLFGDAFEGLVRVSVRMSLAFGGAMILIPLEEIKEMKISTVWQSLEVRNDKEEAEVAKLHKELGVIERFVLQKLGYNQDEIREILSSPVHRAKVAAAVTGVRALADIDSDDGDEA